MTQASQTDINNLYGNAMRQSLPYAGFECMSPKVIATVDVTTWGDDAAEGVLLEVDLEYPRELHDRRLPPLCFARN